MRRYFGLASAGLTRSSTKPRTSHAQNITLTTGSTTTRKRLNGEFRDPEKVARGLKKEDSLTVRSFRVHYNCIKPYTGLEGDTPADKAGTIIEGPNKWMTPMQNAAMRRAERARNEDVSNESSDS